FGSVDRALLQCRIDVTGRKLLRHDADALYDPADDAAADAHLQAFEVFDGLDFLAEEAAHLRAGISRREADDVEFGHQLVHQLFAVAEAKPGIHLTRVETERERRAEGEGRVLPGIVVAGGVADL